MFKKLATFLLGGLVLLICLEVGCRVAYKAYAYARDRENQKNLLQNPGEVRILAVGESTTGVAGDESGQLLLMRKSYPAQLQDLLNSGQNKIHFRVINAGIMAGTTSMIIDDLNRNLRTYKPQIVIAMMGLKDNSNTQSRSMPALKVVQLGRWLFETISLKMKFCDGCRTDGGAERGKVWWMTRYIRETRVANAKWEDASPLPLLDQALAMWNFGHHRASVLLFDRIADRFQVGYYFLARLLASDGQFDQALQVLSRARGLLPKEGMYPIAEAELRGELGQFSRAHALLLEVDKLLPTFHEPKLIENFKLLAEGEVFRRQHDYKRALRSIERVDEKLIVPNLKDFFPPLDMLKEGARGEIYFDMGDWVAARRHLQTVVAKYPMETAYQFRLAATYRKLNDLEGEEKMRREIFERRSYDFRLADYYEYDKLLKLMGKTEQIPTLFEEATKRLPSLSRNFAALYEQTKRSGAKLILMQYPGFSTDIMKMYAPRAKDITVVDNEHLFDADPERYFFEPRYPYAYSHFTKDGAALVARQAKSAIDSYLNGEGR